MCTAISLNNGNHYFGRNLDLEGSFGEGVVVTPRNYVYNFRRAGSASGTAIIGMAIVQENFPLYFDGVNEYGLGMAGLNFPQNAAYLSEKQGYENVTPFEIIPYVLCRCKSVEEAKKLLSNVNIVNIPFSERFPLTPLHWIISDKNSSIVAEPCADGLKVYDNPVNVLTNNPPFPVQLARLNDYINLSPYEAENRFCTSVELSRYSRGMGAMGLPGDWSSASRFVRAVFTLSNLVAGTGEEESVSAFFHTLNAVAMPRGCVRLKEGVYEETVYSSCCNTDKGIYYYTTYSNPSINCVNIHSCDLCGNVPLFFALDRHMRLG